MGIYDNLQSFGGLPVVPFDTEKLPDDPATVAWSIDLGYVADTHPTLGSDFEQLLDRTGPAGPTALIIGEWADAYETPFPYEVLAHYASRLSALRSLFVGEMTGEQCEISWIHQGDVTPALEAFPALERLWVRGSDGLTMRPVRHENLRELVFQSGGLPAEVVRAVGACDLPALTHLELWLGVDEYGGDARAEDVAPILAGRLLPALTYLGLRNAEIADEIATAVAAAPIVARITDLDLSMGALGDAGAEALLTGQPLTHLRSLNLRHHFMSDETAQRLVDELPGVSVDVTERQQEEEWGRYTEVSE